MEVRLLVALIKARASTLKGLDNCIIALGGVYFIYWTLTMTTFGIELPDIFKIALLGVMCIVAFLRILCLGLRNRKIWFSLAMALIECCVFLVSGYGFFLFIAALTVGFVEVDYNKVLTVYLLSVGCTVAVAVVCSIFGIIDNIIREVANHGSFRASMGMIYPTDFASICLCLLMFLWVRWKKLPDALAIVCPIISFLISWLVTDSRTSMACSVLFLAAVLLSMADHWLSGRFKHIRRFRDTLFLFVFPLCTLVAIIATWAYGKGNEVIVAVDSVVSYRLSQGWKAWMEHGLRPFGSAFEMIGFGGATAWVHGYNFIDISYLLIVIRYGYVLILALTVAWGYTLRQVERANDLRLALVMIILCVHSLSEHHFIEMNYNAMLVLPFAAYPIGTSGNHLEVQASKAFFGQDTIGHGT